MGCSCASVLNISTMKTWLYCRCSDCNVQTGPNWLDGAPGQPYCGPKEIYALLHRWRDVCLRKSRSEECRHQGVHRASRSCWAQPWSSSPTFLLPLISTRRGSPISRKKVLFSHTPHHQLPWTILFAETEKNRN